ncbi:MAG: fumarylacetoacetase [Terracidiphilus sp.]
MILASWVSSANQPDSDFPLQNLPYGVFRYRNQNRIGVAIGDCILDLHACAQQGLLAPLPGPVVSACCSELLNPLMSLGPASWSALRIHLTALLDAEAAGRKTQARVEPLLVPMRDAVPELPARVGGYTDFYASIHHAARVGALFRPDHPLLPNYKYVPIGYHGRTSSIVVSGTQIRRPRGQTKSAAAEPVFAPAQSLDYELEIGIFMGPGNPLGQSIPIARAEEHIFGLCLVNDWSARDIQSWEYQPLGPFLAKNFATTISPWIVPLEALAPYRVPVFERPPGDPVPLAYLSPPDPARGGIDLTLEVFLQSALMRRIGAPPAQLSRGNLRDLYWAIAQLVAHHSSNGCNLCPGDLLATGTISGAALGSEGCLLEKRCNHEPVCLPSGELRTFLQDGDQVTFRGYCQKPGWPRIGFGPCTGTVVTASDEQ